jgi:lactoylglutathione lyase
MKLSPISTAVLVSDKKKALRWYHQKLGLGVIDNDDHWVVVGDKKTGAQLHLCELRSRKGKPKLEPGNTGILFVTDGDMIKTYQTLRRRGVRFPNPPKKTEWGWFCMFADPDGNQFWLHPSF